MSNLTDSSQPVPVIAAPSTAIQALRGFAWLLALQAAGELTVKQFGLTLPGPVLGMIFLLFALRWISVQTAVAGCAEFLLAHLSLLFVPVGVGVMTHLGIFSDFGWRIAFVLVVSTWVGLSVTALTLRWLQRQHLQNKRTE
jgi:holin-like protein